MEKKILLINAGSSSIKFQLIDFNNCNIIARGICDAIGLSIGAFKIIYNNCQDIKNINFDSFNNAIKYIFDYFKLNNLISKDGDIVAIGHRVVHDGGQTNGTVIIDKDIIKIIEHYSSFAPLHNPFELEVIKICTKLFPKTIQIACFDTGFHHTIPKENYMYAIKMEYFEKYNIRKFGFHGLSYEFINLKMQEILKKKNNNLIVCHLGSGSSICCIKDSKSFATSMGFATYDGLIMGTRIGDISPGVMNFLTNKLNVSVNEINTFFLKECGLKGLCGSNDMRIIEANLTKPENQFAFDLFVNRIVEYICVYLNKLENQVDALIFTGGIGENSALVRKAIVERLKIRKIILDDIKNTSKICGYEKISSKKSDLNVYVVKTNEELIIARNVKALIS